MIYKYNMFLVGQIYFFMLKVKVTDKAKVTDST